MGTSVIVTDDHGSACPRGSRVDAAAPALDHGSTPLSLGRSRQMTAPSDRYTVALQGFTPFERSALASFFRLAAARTPAYVQAERIDDCDFLVADGDDAKATQAVRDAARMADTVFIGMQIPGAMV